MISYEVYMPQVKAKPVFEKIVTRHLRNHFGTFEKHKHNSSRYWKVGNKVVRIYYYTDPRTELFIAAISKNVLKSLQNEDAYFVGANYYSKDENMFTVYFVRPETIQKHYIDAEIKPRGSGNEWHIKIKHQNNHLVFYRKGEDVVEFPVDKNNYYMQFIMTDKEYKGLSGVLPKVRVSPRIKAL